MVISIQKLLSSELYRHVHSLGYDEDEIFEVYIRLIFIYSGILIKIKICFASETLEQITFIQGHKTL